ncbi:MAG TPA: hypothetical protein VGA13_07275 [Acidimicrobiales bacterium]
MALNTDQVKKITPMVLLGLFLVRLVRGRNRRAERTDHRLAAGTPPPPDLPGAEDSAVEISAPRTDLSDSDR